ncbi:hypothetical protein [Hymenobacter wooponensis]|uniref:CBM-cenC domain-containing protein n=1 Tax=Hymenobacter wooponensis TaxID=1525360 RepID=A0A4Z0MGN9_9BACT|nr:hypothetical protein [Hymenobacter wooponensis]TGD78530.1 hypothetical protein EU557_20740 [Hymenobacter wooponensis]
MKNFLWVAALIGLAACSSSDEKKVDANTLTSTSFEEIAGWGVDMGTLSRERAHTGVYALKVDNAHDFSLTYDVVVGQVSPRKIKKINVHGWVFLPSTNTNAILGLQVTDPSQDNKAIWGDGIKMDEAVKDYNKWVEVSKDMEMPAELAPTHHLKMYLWRAGAIDPVYADDLSIQVIE